MLSTTFFLLAERAEEATINANRAQMANEEQLNLIMQAMPDVAAIINEERQFVYGNQKLLTFLGFGSVEDLGSLRLGEAVGCKNAFDHEGGCGTGEYCRYCGAAQAMQQAMQKGERVAKECRISTQTANGPGSLELLVTVSPFPLMGRQIFFAHHSMSDGKKIVVSTQAVQEVLHADKTILRRVITNMVKNALEACKPKDTVTLCCNWSNGRLIFQVHNPGHIPKAIQAQIFQHSFSTKGHNRGLGTYSIKLLTERYLKGEVGFSSNEVSGTMFYAAIPAQPA